MRLATIAITGGIAEGKSTVLGYLREAGYSTVSSDHIAAELLADPKIGKEVALAAGLLFPIDRSAMMNRILHDVAVRRRVNALMHGPIFDAITKANADFAEVPLLIEACLQDRFAATWVVTCGLETQRQRLLERLGSDVKTADLLSTQLHPDTKLAFADRVIRTNAGADRVKVSTLEAAAER